MAIDLLTDLNEPQRQAVDHTDGPLLVLAGAGSGKTRVITHRVARLIQGGVRPHNVLAITFTNKAAEEMRDRARALGAARGATLCTFHSLCAALLREFAREAHIRPSYSIYDRDDQIRLVRQAMADLNLADARPGPQGMHTRISNAKNELKTPAALADEADSDTAATAVKVYRRYEQLLAANNALDFDDLLLRMAFLLRDHDDVGRRLSERFRYLLIDEYQDTNHAQYVIAHGIAAAHQNLCVTGDPDQSIYAWRGADIRNILEFERDYPSARVIRLEENYRSTQPILASASKLISCNVLRKEKALWSRRAGGADVRVLHCDDARSEAAEVATRIQRRKAHGRDHGDVAVFYRINSLSRLLEEALLAEGIPYRVARGVEFYNRKEIKDVLAYLRLLVNPDDSLSCRRIINVPSRGIGAATIKRLAALAEPRALSLPAACARCEEAQLSSAAAKKVHAFVELIDDLRSGLDRPVRDVVQDVIDRCGLAQMHRDEGPEGYQALEDVEEMVSAAAEFDARQEGATLADYLQQVSLVSDVDGLADAGGAVTLMTLHAAKGLEFPAVFVVGCEVGLLPFQRPDLGPGAGDYAAHDLEEERRLAFVGMTRAKDELTLSCAAERMVRGRTESQTPSTFLSEIGQEHVTVEDLRTERQPRRRRARAGGGFYADVEERAVIEALAEQTHPLAAQAGEEADYPAEYEYLKVGCRVRHPQFGPGKLVSVKGRWPRTRAVIDFDQCGRKTIVLQYADLDLM